MIEAVNVTINNKKYKIRKGTTLEEIANEFQKDYKYPIILANVDGRTKELTTPISNECSIEFLDLTTRDGNRVHISGLTYILIYAVKKLYGKNADVSILHSLDKGIYAETNFKLTEEKVQEIKEKMKEIVKADMPITRVVIDRFEAINYFEEIGDTIKAGIMNYNTNSFVTLYRLGNYYNYFYNAMPTSTKVLGSFNLTYIKNNGFILQFPTIYIPDKIKKYEHHPGMFEAFKEYHDWGNIMNIRNAVELNRIVSAGRINDLIRIDETLQNSKLLSIAKEIHSKKNVRIVLMAGPSSSGKTTTSRKICLYLQSLGLTPRVISMDDYFVDKNQTPVDKDGKPDYECLEALDIKLFDKQVAELLSGKEIVAPTYNFIAGKKEFDNKMSLGENELLLIEGIHALDTKILTNISRDKKYKLYLSPVTELNIDDHNRISTTDNRLLRRIVRDNRTRGYPVEKTLAAWDAVRSGEEKYIFPFQDEADYTVNTALIYELGVLRTYVEPLLYSVPKDNPYYEEAKRLLKFLRIFFTIPADAIPQDSIIREFIGMGCFLD